MSPVAVNRDGVPTEMVEHEKEVIKAEIKNDEKNKSKPEDIIEKSKAMGLFGLSILEEYGGLGLSMVGKCAIYEELGKTHNGYTTLIGAHTGIGTVGIVELGTEEQKRRYLPKMATGERIGAFALTEPSAGSNAAAIGRVPRPSIIAQPPASSTIVTM